MSVDSVTHAPTSLPPAMMDESQPNLWPRQTCLPHTASGSGGKQLVVAISKQYVKPRAGEIAQWESSFLGVGEFLLSMREALDSIPSTTEANTNVSKKIVPGLCAQGCNQSLPAPPSPSCADLVL